MCVLPAIARVFNLDELYVGAKVRSRERAAAASAVAAARLHKVEAMKIVVKVGRYTEARIWAQFMLIELAGSG